MSTIWTPQDIEPLTKRVRTCKFYRLKTIKVKLLDACNFKCPKCDIWRKNHKDELPLEILARLFDEGVTLDLVEVSLTGGEPTLKADLKEIVEYGTGKGIEFRIITNGAFLEPHQYRSLIDSGLRRWTFSLDAQDAEEHYVAVGIPDAYERVIRSISAVSNERQRSKKVQELNALTVVTRHNYESIPAIVKLAIDLGMDSIRLFPYDFRQSGLNTATRTRNLSMSRSDIETFNDKIVPELDRLAATTQISIYPDYSRKIFGSTDEDIHMAEIGDVALGFYQAHTCFAPWHHLAVFANGDVHICCKKPCPPIGNLKHSTLTEIVNSPAMDCARSLFAQRLHPDACRSCNSKTYENRYLGDAIGK